MKSVITYNWITSNYTIFPNVFLVLYFYHTLTNSFKKNRVELHLKIKGILKKETKDSNQHSVDV